MTYATHPILVKVKTPTINLAPFAQTLSTGIDFCLRKLMGLHEPDGTAIRRADFRREAARRKVDALLR